MVSCFVNVLELVFKIGRIFCYKEIVRVVIIEDFKSVFFFCSIVSFFVEVIFYVNGRDSIV